MKVLVVLLEAVIGSILAARMQIDPALLLPRRNSSMQFGPSRIVGGENADIQEFPYQVSVQYYGQHICGGSIIGNRKILTAAHCTDGRLVDLFKVRAGSTYHATGGQKVQVARIDQNPFYNPSTYDRDVSVLTLVNDLQMNDSVEVIRLASYEPSERSDSYVSGWGALSEGGSMPANLRSLMVPIISRDTCNNYYNNAITAYMICAGYAEGGCDACQGDSGGPLATNGVLTGVVSWGIGCAQKNHPGVFANVASLRSFIDAQL